ncbi:MAG TPA: hypothetical protein PKA00_20890 [Saprospiraceae bacterium]|nr:hypothetical protein [Saprospiraceae bacterium]HMQ85380.1 hypothetical protein [Saprospiraceae bacterium]
MSKPFVFIFFCALLSACNQEPSCGADKTQFIKKYNELISDINAAKLPTSDKGWAKYDNAFRAYVEECYDQHESEMTGKEKRQFWGKALKYYSQRYGEGIVRELDKSADKTANRLNDYIKATGQSIESIKRGKIQEKEKLQLKRNKGVETE